MVPTNDDRPAGAPVIRGARVDSRNTDARPSARPSETTRGPVQGEGNYDAAREFNEAESKFVASGKVDAAARAAAPRSDAEQREMLSAEKEGKRRAKGEDPALRRTSSGAATPEAPAADAKPKHG